MRSSSGGSRTETHGPFKKGDARHRVPALFLSLSSSLSLSLSPFLSLSLSLSICLSFSFPLSHLRSVPSDQAESRFMRRMFNTLKNMARWMFRCTRDTEFNSSDDDDSDVVSHTPWRSHGLLCLALVSRAVPYGTSAIIGELRCLFGSASADQSRLTARSSPVLAFVSLLDVASSRAPHLVGILRVHSHRPARVISDDK